MERADSVAERSAFAATDRAALSAAATDPGLPHRFLSRNLRDHSSE